MSQEYERQMSADWGIQEKRPDLANTPAGSNVASHYCGDCQFWPRGAL